MTEIEKKIDELKEQLEESQQSIIINSWIVGAVFFIASIYSDIIGAFLNGLVN